MPTPIAHVLAGGSIGTGLGRSAWLRRDVGSTALYALLPDLDFVAGSLFGDPYRFHHDFSHSVFFAVGIGFVVVLLVRQDRFRQAALAVAGYGSHLLLDLVTVDASRPLGMALFWPLSSVRVHAPFSLLPGPRHSGAMLTRHNLAVGATELLLFGLLFLWAFSRRARSRSEPRDRRRPPRETETPGRS